MYILGKNPTDDYLDKMMSEAPGPINFTMFLTMFGEKLNGTDPEDVIKNAFACFDEDNTGTIYRLFYQWNFKDKGPSIIVNIIRNIQTNQWVGGE